ncbi:hypothetical protein SAMN05216474_2554 [Lishizhenia tianjinensis]|uniref:Acetyltransferase (GNAT) domain-containing protein n=1 Tax=Lishizhenia tianjinensis TaxID=477690 RepID=A0A1I7B4U3_9FLAO|nr:hypothetical protein [Lishizhenia tianjinensis]SFT82220.1 hypothetical protein SAMN05216474_2554 [Lishizhenia tianjinensis]
MEIFHNIFTLRTEASAALMQLLKKNTLGTNGAKYKHLDTERRMQLLYDPLFLSLERHGKCLGNVTFCRREKQWYVRYFAFDALVQGAGKTPSRKKNSSLKTHLNAFFSDKLQSGEAKSFYAYIDPKNVKSLWMSAQFNFLVKANIATQTFSRRNPKRKITVEILTDHAKIKNLVREHFAHQKYFFDHHIYSNTDPFYIAKQGTEIIAFGKFHYANWVFERLPGKMGALLTKVIPYLPGLRKIIKPKAHSFLAPEAVWVKNEDPKLLSTFLESVLHAEKRNLILWWIDEKSKLYQQVKDKVNWGLLHKINGVHEVNFVEINASNDATLFEEEVYSCAFDFI